MSVKRAPREETVMRNSIFLLNNPNAPRLSPELAKEIGLNESILLLQFEFWIRTSTTEAHEGKQWTYQSITDIQSFFPFWGTRTINRTIHSLVAKKLIAIGKFNKAKYDKTRWFSINPEGFSKIKSIILTQSSGQNDTGSRQNDTRRGQNDTTIPESTTESTTVSRTKSVREPSGYYVKDGLGICPAFPPIEGGSGEITHVSFDSLDDKPKKPAVVEPTTPLSKYLREMSKYGNRQWEGFRTVGERDDWLKMEQLFAYDDIKGAINWACSNHRFGKSILVDRIIAAVNNNKKAKSPKATGKVVVNKDCSFYV